MSDYQREVLTQPELWRRAMALGAAEENRLPRPGARVALVGCGTSLYVAQAVAAFREAQGTGETDAFAASEMPLSRSYDLVVAISRSGTTTEVLDVLGALAGRVPTLAITAMEGGEIAARSDEQIVLSWADERSIVQTRFATTVLALLLGRSGWDVAASADAAEQLLAGAAPSGIEDVEQFVFLGRGFAAAIANEAALKMRETLGMWTEAYPTREFRHGPISAIGERSLVWFLDDAEPSIDAAIRETGARLWRPVADPLAELVRVHQAAGVLAEHRGVNPDAPRHLTRSIILAD